MNPNEKRRRIASLTKQEAEAILYDWRFWARPKQLAPPGNWSTWVIKAGRGSGKTRTGAEWVRDRVISGKSGRLALIAKDPGEARDVMIEGESGLLAIHHPHERPSYQPSKKRLTWPNGALATVYSSEDPEELRGPQHDGGWIDEYAKQKNQQEVWDNYQLGLRLGFHPQTVMTTTPRPTKALRAILKSPFSVVTGGTTFDNRENLPAQFFEAVIARYDGTRLGRQEIYAELLEDTPGALWSLGLLEDTRDHDHGPQDMFRTVVAIDPSASSDEGAAETGIVACGAVIQGADQHGYVLADASGVTKPVEWGRRAIKLYHDLHADLIVAEKNNGGEMIQAVIESIDPRVPVKLVWASKGKHTRAEPIATLWERHMLHLCGTFPELEDQMCTYVPGEKSPDRMDAMIWGFTELFDVAPIDLSSYRMEVEQLSTIAGPWG